MNASSYKIKLVKLRKDLDREGFLAWYDQHLAIAHHKGYCEILLTGAEEVIEQLKDKEGNVDSKELGKVNMLNSEAYADLVLVTGDDKTVARLVKNSKTDFLPRGDAWEAWKKITRKFMPDTASARRNLEKEFQGNELTSVDKNPEEWAAELESIQNTMCEVHGRKRSEMEKAMVEHLMSAVMIDDYDVVLRSLQTQIDGGEDISSDDIVDELSTHFAKLQERRSKLGKGRRSSSRYQADNDDAAMATGLAKFKGLCHGCGKPVIQNLLYRKWSIINLR